MVIRAVEEERVGVEVFHLGGKGNMPERRPWAPPPFEYGLLRDNNLSGMLVV